MSQPLEYLPQEIMNELGEDRATYFIDIVNERLIVIQVDPYLYKDVCATLFDHIRQSQVTLEGKLKMSVEELRIRILDYVNLCVFVTYRMLGFSELDSFRKGFPEYPEYLVKNKARRYSNSHRVSQILEASIAPYWVTHKDVYEQAMNTQVDLLHHKTSPKVRQKAADSLMAHLGKPKEDKRITVEANVTNVDSIDYLKETMNKLVKTQLSQLENQENG